MIPYKVLLAAAAVAMLLAVVCCCLLPGINIYRTSLIKNTGINYDVPPPRTNAACTINSNVTNI